MNKILITGGAGFIGSNLSNQLFKMGKKVYVIDDLSRGNKKFLEKGIDLVIDKVESGKAARALRKIKPDYIVHLAAESSLATSLENPQTDLKKNLFPIVPLLDICQEIKIKKFVFASSAAVFGINQKLPIDEFCKKEPLSPYGLSKLTCEYYLEYINRRFGLPYNTLRFANVYGPNQNSTAEGGVVAIFISKVLSGGVPVIYGDGRQTRDFIYVKDIVDAIMASLSSKISGDFNVGTAKETTVSQLLEVICKVTKKKVSAKYDTMQDFGVIKSALTYKKIESELRWKPKIKLEEGIKQAINFMGKSEQ